MKYGEKEKQNQMKRQTTLNNFRYNRFLLLRYVLAIFFFINLYWFLALLASGSVLYILPICLLILSIPAIAEHVKLYGEKSDQIRHQLQFNLCYHYLQIMINIALSFVAITEVGYLRLYPFLTNAIETKILLIMLLILGGTLSLACIYRMKNIQSQKDKHYHYMKEFKKLNR